MNKHLSLQQMLGYLDGELSKSETTDAAEHLHACWTCRIEMDRLEGDIAVILDAHNEAFIPAIPLPLSAWASFETLIRQNRPPARRSNWSAVVGGFRQAFTPHRVVVLGGLVIACALFVYLRAGTQAVSAQEVISRVRLADAKRLAVPQGVVIRERLQVRRIPNGAAAPPARRMDAWKSPTATVWQSSGEGSEDAVSELKGVYASHGIAVDLPLSAAGIDSWSALSGGTPTLTKEGSDFGLNFVGSPNSKTGLSAVTARIEPSTWHVKDMTIQFPDSSVEITESEEAAVPISEVPLVLLAELEPNSLPLPSKAQPVSDIGSPMIRSSSINMDQVQLDVLAVLHRLHADLGEPISIAHSNKTVTVGVWHLPGERQLEIRAALKNEPGVMVQTTEPIGQMRAATSSVGAAVPGLQNKAIVAADTADEALTKYFGEAKNEQAFTREAMEKSSTALAHLYALRNLQAQFPPERERTLSPIDQARLESIVQDHVTVTIEALSQLKIQLAPLDEAFHVGELSQAQQSTYEITWQDASLDALGTARTVDRLIRDIFTTSESPYHAAEALPQLQQELARLLNEMGTVQKKMIVR